MLRIDLLGNSTIRMSGRMAEGCREEIENFVSSRTALSEMVVDLSQVTYFDWAGEAALCWLGRLGARFTANNPYSLHVCERLRLRMAETGISSQESDSARRGGQHE
jgi:hypothetical protein